MTENKEIILTKNKWHQLSETHFSHATDGQKADQITIVKMMVDEHFLFLDFVCENNPYVNENSYLDHNTDMWNQEVFELFISEGEKIPTKYLEIEINPNNALFVGWIQNSSGEAPESCEFIEHNSSGIIHGIQKEKSAWKGFLNIPLDIIGSISNNYRLNLFRIVSKQSHKKSDWKCDMNNTDFTCWNATLSGKSPRFHRPSAFGKLNIL